MQKLWGRHSHLWSADLSDADLSGAVLVSADLSGANLSNAVLYGAKYNSQTVWPDGLDADKAGALLIEDD